MRSDTGAVRLLDVVKILTLCLAVTLNTAIPAQQKTSKTKVLSQKLSNVKKQKSQVQQKLHAKKKEVYITAAEVEQLDNRITGVQDKLADTRSKLASSKVEQSRLAGELGKAHKALLEKKGIVSRRIRSMYMSGDETVLTVLVGADGFADFAARKSLLERIAKRDHELFDSVKSLRDQIAVKKKKQDQYVDQVAQLRAQQQMQEQDLKSAMGHKKSALDQLRQQRDYLEEQLAEMEAESLKIEAQIRAYQMANAGKIAPYKGRFMIPVRGRFSSPFGMRTHPISGVYKMHTGQDIAAPTGSPIRAGGPGVVIFAGWRNGYGNTIIIDHGGGISTLYGHCSRLIAHAGQHVTTGETIAAVGSTGYSTGPHCHFEVRVNGKPVNPLRYIGR